MPAGRPRLTPEAYQARLDAYCARYKVTPLATGIPPFPAGKRETAQHREWISLYKAQSRLARTERAQVEGGPCPICGLEIGPADALQHSAGPGRLGAALHNRCHQLATLAAAVGPEAVARLRRYLWPSARGQR